MTIRRCDHRAAEMLHTARRVAIEEGNWRKVQQFYDDDMNLCTIVKQSRHLSTSPAKYRESAAMHVYIVIEISAVKHCKDS